MCYGTSTSISNCVHTTGKEGDLTWVVSEGSLHKVMSEDDGVSSRRLVMSGEAEAALGPFSGDRSFSPTLSAASSERVLTYEAGIQPTWDPSLRTAAHQPDSSCLTIARISSFRNERWSESDDEKSNKHMTKQMRS
jgi:hypothetical protein